MDRAEGTVIDGTSLAPMQNPLGSARIFWRGSDYESEGKSVGCHRLVVPKLELGERVHLEAVSERDPRIGGGVSETLKDPKAAIVGSRVLA